MEYKIFSFFVAMSVKKKREYETKQLIFPIIKCITI